MVNLNGFDPVQALSTILAEGSLNRSSDIHLEPNDDHMSIRYRVDGVLIERDETIPSEYAPEIINRIKVMAEMDISVSKAPQDGQLKMKIEDEDFLARVSTLPTKKGEKAVLRVIKSNSPVVPLNMLAPDRRTVNILKRIAGARQGLFLVTGPTGSGKSTTLYSLLHEINNVGVNIVTLEDPVEKEIPGLSQVQINKKAGLSFVSALKAFLRQDPDVIMVGEIRDEESARIVTEAAITGHLVLSTMHTNSSLDVANRLEELGVSPVTIAAAMLGTVSQRLLRANCKTCLIERVPNQFEIALFKEFLPQVEPPKLVKEGTGCPRCNNTGYLDRIPVFEIWRNTDKMTHTLAHMDRWENLKTVAKEDGFESLIEFALKMVLSGLTSMDEVKRCLS